MSVWVVKRSEKSWGDGAKKIESLLGQKIWFYKNFERRERENERIRSLGLQRSALVHSSDEGCFLLQIGAELLGNVCKVCGKVFNGRNWKQNLEYHFLTHTKQKPFKCPICPHSSALKYNLIRHIRNRHSELLSPAYQNQQGDREGHEMSGQGSQLPLSRLVSREIQLPPVRESQLHSNHDIQLLHSREIQGAQNPTEVQMPSNQEVPLPPNCDIGLPLSQENQLCLTQEGQLNPSLGNLMPSKQEDKM